MTWEIDPTHSHMSFAIRVMSVTTTRGRFNALGGQLHIDEQHPANSWVDAQVEAASIDTRSTPMGSRAIELASAGRGAHMIQYKGCVIHVGARRGGNHCRD